MNASTTPSRIATHWWRWLLTALLCLFILLKACGDKMVPASIHGYNHMPRFSWGILGFSINGAEGLNLSPESGGGGETCCVQIPERWHPGMKVKVTWIYSTRPSGPAYPVPPPQEADVEIPDYSGQEKGPGGIDVHFYPGHRIKVVVSPYDIRHPRYPMSAADKLPWTN